MILKTTVAPVHCSFSHKADKRFWTLIKYFLRRSALVTSWVLGSNGKENSLKDSGDLDHRIGRAPERP
jgi:hypothetical protein